MFCENVRLMFDCCSSEHFWYLFLPSRMFLFPVSLICTVLVAGKRSVFIFAVVSESALLIVLFHLRVVSVQSSCSCVSAAVGSCVIPVISSRFLYAAVLSNCFLKYVRVTLNPFAVQNSINSSLFSISGSIKFCNVSPSARIVFFLIISSSRAEVGYTSLAFQSPSM